jgi:phosphoribosylglycinamide formyltransferase-1
MLSVVVLVSGSGSNLQALLKQAANPLFPAKVLAVGSDRACAGLEHAEQFGVPTFVVEPSQFDSKQAWGDVLLQSIEFQKPDLVILAGFMKILPANVVKALSPRLINMHPSLLPEFPGAHAVRDALAAGATKTGATIHFVDEGVDTGKVIVQEELLIPAGISEVDLHEQIKTIERKQLVQLVSDIATGTVKISGEARNA